MRSVSVALALLYAAAAPAWAGSASGTASLDNLRFSVVDLAPDDGQDAWYELSAVGGTRSDAFVDSTGQTHYLPAPLGETASQLITVDGRASASTDADRLWADIFFDGSREVGGRAVGITGGSVLLGARSAIQLSGDAVLELAQDFGAGWPIRYLEGSVLLDLFQYGQPVLQNAISFHTYEQDVSFSRSATLSVIFSNDSDEAVWVNFTAQAWTQSVPVQLVPEPGAALLMLAGLGMLGACGGFSRIRRCPSSTCARTPSSP